MEADRMPLVRAIRKFNRFYTNVLGLLDRHLLDSDFSLSEARVLYEIGNAEKGTTATALIAALRIDAGYLSRMLKRFDKQGLINRSPSKDDGRSHDLYLSDRGKTALARLDALSDEQIRHMLDRLPEREQRNVIKSMTAIEQALSDEAGAGREIHIRSELRPGDVGTLIHLHGWIYAQECGYNHAFEGYVCKTFHDFFERYSPDKARFWFAEAEGETVGAIAIVGHSAEKAQLRWFILHPAYRGIGLGKMLHQAALQYCRDKGYREVFLETTEDQKTAIRMYIKEGFRKTAEWETRSWGVSHVEQIYELRLPGSSSE